MHYNDNLDEIYNIFNNVNKMLIEIWKEEILFSWRWWLGLILSIIPWIIWIKFRSKKYTVRLLFTGMIVVITTSFLDLIGITYGAWHYDWKVLPLIPMFIPWYFTLFPIAIMFFLQYKPAIKAIYKSIVFGVFCAFIFEPLFSWLGLYHSTGWNHLYSFIIYIPLYLFYNYI